MMKSIVFSHTGKRKSNQDFVFIQTLQPGTDLFLVTDGMGGYEYGAEAAKLVAEHVFAYLSTVKEVDSGDIQKAINKANLAIRQLKKRNAAEIGATIGGVVLKSSEALCFWVGDVKIFYFSKNELRFESHSHTLMNEVKANGSITNLNQLEKFRHVVTRSVQGDLVSSQIDFHRLPALSHGDVVIICSDGVHDLFDGIQIQQILHTSETVEEAIRNMENRVVLESKDNVSLICLELS